MHNLFTLIDVKMLNENNMNNGNYEFQSLHIHVVDHIVVSIHTNGD